jgi:hypothetical protein
MKYRILRRSESEYRVQYKHWFWPFWTNVKQFISPYSVTVHVFANSSEAQAWIQEDKLWRARAAKPWRKVWP